MQPTPDLSGKTILVTGATRGIGLATAQSLAGRGGAVILHGRDRARVERACQQIERSSPGSAVTGIVADLSSLAAVRRLAEEVDAGHARLDVLINNAGLVTRRRELTVDGFERQFAVNHLAPFLLTHLLLDKLKASAPARIVTVASMAHHRSALDLDDLNWERRRYRGIRAYGATKLANILFTRALAQRLQGSNVTTNCLHPGVVGTNIFTGLGILGTLFGVLSKPLLLSANDGARTSIHVATANDLNDSSGLFFSECRAVEPSAEGRDDRLAERLWALSETMVRPSDSGRPATAGIGIGIGA